MSKAFATTVIFDESRSRVLLMLREDFHLMVALRGLRNRLTGRK